MKKVAVLALSVILLGVWGCSQPQLTMEQRKKIDYLEALAEQKDREAARTESLALQQIQRANELREEAQNYRRKAKLVTKGRDIDEMEESMRDYRR